MLAGRGTGNPHTWLAGAQVVWHSGKRGSADTPLLGAQACRVTWRFHPGHVPGGNETVFTGECRPERSASSVPNDPKRETTQVPYNGSTSEPRSSCWTKHTAVRKNRLLPQRTTWMK